MGCCVSTPSGTSSEKKKVQIRTESNLIYDLKDNKTYSTSYVQPSPKDAEYDNTTTDTNTNTAQLEDELISHQRGRANSTATELSSSNSFTDTPYGGSVAVNSYLRQLRDSEEGTSYGDDDSPDEFGGKSITIDTSFNLTTPSYADEESILQREIPESLPTAVTLQRTMTIPKINITAAEELKANGTDEDGLSTPGSALSLLSSASSSAREAALGTTPRDGSDPSAGKTPRFSALANIEHDVPYFVSYAPNDLLLSYDPHAKQIVIAPFDESHKLKQQWIFTADGNICRFDKKKQVVSVRNSQVELLKKKKGDIFQKWNVMFTQVGKMNVATETKYICFEKNKKLVLALSRTGDKPALRTLIIDEHHPTMQMWKIVTSA